MMLTRFLAAALAAWWLVASPALAAVANGFANGSFEDATPQAPLPAGYSSPANHWVAPPSTGSVESMLDDPHGGSRSVRLRTLEPDDPVVLQQHSVIQGGLPPLVAGDIPVLGFWARGQIGQIVQGEFRVALRYLDDAGHVLYDSGHMLLRCQMFQTDFCQELAGPRIAWTAYSFTGAAVPEGATAALVEFTLLQFPYTGGPPGHPDVDRSNRVFLDDVSLSVSAVPEADGFAMMCAGLWVVGAAARRRARAPYQGKP